VLWCIYCIFFIFTHRPYEYTNTLVQLQDQCYPSTINDINDLFVLDTGKSIHETFDYFDPAPIGVASLAQVHKALYKGQEVAVKIQHPSLKKYTDLDIETTVSAVKIVKYFFPDFEFGWLADEMKINLPLEMDFSNEGSNILKVSSNFTGHPVLVLPKVFDSRPRILIMEFCQGTRIDNHEFLRGNNIAVDQVSSQLSKIFNQMIFKDGFVHCDPHSGNIFVKSRKLPWYKTIPLVSTLCFRNSFNFEIVLLDHGLYKTLDRDFVLNYANLWDSIIRADEAAIEKYSYNIFKNSERVSKNGIDHHRLFASMLTGRSWEAITGSGLATESTQHERNVILRKAGEGDFFAAVAGILAKCPGELLLLLKTNDLLRAIDKSLKITGSNKEQLVRSISSMGWFCEQVILKEAESSIQGIKIFKLSYWKHRFHFWVVGLRLYVMEYGWNIIG
jgi:aarF domain-containing kinase